MRFKITKTSNIFDTVKPCEDCIEDYEIQEVWYNFKPETLDRIQKNDNLVSYIIVEDEKNKIIKCIIKSKIWVKDFKTLEELIEFRNEIDESLIILGSDKFDGEIEIYDDYRE